MIDLCNFQSKWGRISQRQAVQKFFRKQVPNSKQLPNEVPNEVPILKQVPNKVPNEVPNKLPSFKKGLST